ncbi:hypothetical protein QFZ82_003287 [Streptomyces sp. V4I23]|nr:hypothetical protein [Streptomyces sp. V4I23]
MSAAVACALAGRDALDERPHARDGRAALRMVGRLGCAVLAGAAGATLALRLTPRSYGEAALLSAMAGFLVTGVVVCGLLDIRPIPARGPSRQR